MVKPVVENLHGLSPVEDWIQHSQWLEERSARLTAQVEVLEKAVRHYADRLDTSAVAQAALDEIEVIERRNDG